VLGNRNLLVGARTNFMRNLLRRRLRIGRLAVVLLPSVPIF